MAAAAASTPPPSSGSSRSNVKVLCRFRPMNSKEKEMGTTSVIEVPGGGKHGVVKLLTTEKSSYSFNFDSVFDSGSSQQEVYEAAAMPVVNDVIDGYNGCLLAYGQTGAGKTHTMMGPSATDRDLAGIIPRVVNQIFEFASAADETVEFTVQVSFVEIYLERIRDLLDPSKDNLQVGEDPAQGGVYIKHVTEVYVTSVEEMLEVMERGNANRAVAATGMNAGSSRSHSIFVVALTQKDSAAGETKTGRLYLCDLAGSETVNKTGVQGQQLKEAQNINKSLSALGNVINALTDGRTKHVPYRDSKLTRVLQESLGGNSRTSLIINASPAAYNQMETLSTLRFGKRAKSIKNKATINKRRTPEEMERYIAVLEARLAESADREALWVAAVNGGDLDPALVPILQAAGGSGEVSLAEGAAAAVAAAGTASSEGDSSAALDALQARYDDLESRTGTLSSLLAEAGAEVKKQRSSASSAKRKLEAARKSLLESKEHASGLQAEVTAQEEALQAAKAAAAEAEGQAAKAHEEATRLKSEVAALTSRVASLTSAADELRQSKADLVQEKASLEAEHKSLVSQQVAAIEQRVKARKAGGARPGPASPKAAGAAGKSASGWVDDDGAGSSTSAAEEPSTPSSLKAALSEAREEASSMAATAKAEAARADELGQRLSDLDDALAASKESVAQLQEAKAAATARLEALEEEAAEATQAAAKAKAEASELRDTVLDLRKAQAHLQESVHVEEQLRKLGDAALAVAEGRTAELPAADGVVGVAGEPVLEEVWENQRFYPLGGWSDEMLPSDPPAECRLAATGATSASPTDPVATFWGAPAPHEDVALPDAGQWHWLGPWRVDLGGAVDEHGWQYAVDFDDLYRDEGLTGRRPGAPAKAESPTSKSGPSTLAEFRGARSPEDTVRRRRWVRHRVSLEGPPAMQEVSTFLLQATAAPEDVVAGAAGAASARRAVEVFSAQAQEEVLRLRGEVEAGAAATAALRGELSRKAVLVRQYERRIGEILQKMADAASTGNLSHISGSGSSPAQVRSIRGVAARVPPAGAVHPGGTPHEWWWGEWLPRLPLLQPQQGWHGVSAHHVSVVQAAAWQRTRDPSRPGATLARQQHGGHPQRRGAGVLWVVLVVWHWVWWTGPKHARLQHRLRSPRRRSVRRPHCCADGACG